MFRNFGEELLDVGLLLVYSLLSGLLTAFGIFVEYSGLQTYLSGNVYLAVYIAGFGAIVLYFAYLMVTTKLIVTIKRTFDGTL